MQTPFTYPNGYPASLSIRNTVAVTVASLRHICPRDVAEGGV